MSSPLTVLAMLALLTLGCATTKGVATTDGSDTADSARAAVAWSALLREFPECAIGIVLDGRTMERRLEEVAAPLQASLVGDAGIDAGGRWVYPVCRYSPPGASFIALLVETRGGAGGRDEEYRLLTRAFDGRPIDDVVVAATRADCSDHYQIAARIAFPVILTSESREVFDCETDTLVSQRQLSTGTIAIESGGEIREEYLRRE